MLRIRLKRTGKKNSASYRVVVAERSSHPQSEGKEELGHYNPTTDPKEVELKEDRVKYWLDQGAQPSNTVHNLLIEEDIIDGDKRKAVAVGGVEQQQGSNDQGEEGVEQEDKGQNGDEEVQDEDQGQKNSEDDQDDEQVEKGEEKEETEE